MNRGAKQAGVKRIRIHDIRHSAISLLIDMGLNETDKTPLNKYGRMRLRYLQEHRPGFYTRLIFSGKLYEDLLETQKATQDRVEMITEKMATTIKRSRSLILWSAPFLYDSI